MPRSAGFAGSARESHGRRTSTESLAARATDTGRITIALQELRLQYRKLNKDSRRNDIENSDDYKVNPGHY